jgi:hypothetical protein
LNLAALARRRWQRAFAMWTAAPIAGSGGSDLPDSSAGVSATR